MDEPVRRDPARRFGPSAGRDGGRGGRGGPGARDPRAGSGDRGAPVRDAGPRRDAPRDGGPRDEGGPRQNPGAPRDRTAPRDGGPRPERGTPRDGAAPPDRAASRDGGGPRPERAAPPDRTAPRDGGGSRDGGSRPDRGAPPEKGAPRRGERAAGAAEGTRPQRGGGRETTDRPPSSSPSAASRGPQRAGWSRRFGAFGGRGPGRALRIAVTVLSALVLLASGTAWAALSSTVSSGALGGPVGDEADGATDILLVGLDSRTDAQGRPLSREVLQQIGASDEDGTLNTDTMMLLRIRNDGGRAVAYSIPRDSYVSLPGRSGQAKINSAYPGAKAEEASRLVQGGDSDPQDVDVRSSEAGRQALVSAVADLTGVTVDHLAEVNLLGFYNLTTAVGGVDVCLKAPTDDDFSGAHFAAGPRTVAGHDALAFVRQRHNLPQGDLDRVRRQQAFLAGLSHKVLSAGTLADPVTLAKLLGAVRQSVVLDGGWDLLQFAQQMQNITGGAVAFQTIPTEGPESGGDGDGLRVDPTEVARFVSQTTDDAPAPPPAAAPTGPAPPPSSVPVDVRNASGTTGAAAKVVTALETQGFTRTSSGNAEDSVTRSAVLAGPGADAGAALVAKALGGLPTRPDPTVTPGTVRVVLASDYTGPGSTGSTASASTPAPPPPPPITADGVPCVN